MRLEPTTLGFESLVADHNLFGTSCKGRATFSVVLWPHCDPFRPIVGIFTLEDKIMKSISAVVAIVAIIAVFFFETLHSTDWTDIPTGLGGEEVSLDEGGHRCWYFNITSELVCFEEFDTWYGKDAVPLYVINDGGYTPIERSKKY